MLVASISPLLLAEVAATLCSLNNNKALGVDGVTTKILKSKGPDALQWLHLLIIAMWESKVAPSQWKRVGIMLLHKGG
jgi:hypothetical protein